MASKEIIEDIKNNNGVQQLVRTDNQGLIPVGLLSSVSSVSSWEYPEVPILYNPNPQFLTGGVPLVNRGANVFDNDGVLTVNQTGFYMINIYSSFNIFTPGDFINYIVNFEINGGTDILNAVRFLNVDVANSYTNSIYIELQQNDTVGFNFILDQVSGAGSQANILSRINIVFLG